VPSPDLGRVVAAVDRLEGELTALRRDLHAHPELAWAEERTTVTVAQRLEAAGVEIKLLPKSGLLAELGSAEGPLVALRADLDALPVDDRTGSPWCRS
jgi:metal-dependent amidase/aminoacylase/carboxypeptidase family protein